MALHACALKIPATNFGFCTFCIRISHFAFRRNVYLHRRERPLRLAQVEDCDVAVGVPLRVNVPGKVDGVVRGPVHERQVLVVGAVEAAHQVVPFPAMRAYELLRPWRKGKRVEADKTDCFPMNPR